MSIAEFTPQNTSNTAYYETGFK